MNNILAIAHKELKSYFSTPIAYIVIGFFALLFGYFFYAMLIIFNQQSLQLGGLEGGGSVDINQQLIRPLFLNASVILLFVLPWVVNWIASFTGPTTQSVLNYLSITDHFDDFTKGILDTKHLVYYFSVMSFGLFLTARSVDTE